MKPASLPQYEAATRAQLPPVELVREGLWSIPFAMPHGHIKYSLGYLVDDFSGALHIVDPGWPTDENWAVLNAVTRSLGKTVDDIATVIATHLHPDHLGMAGRIRERSGAVVVLHATEDDAATEIRSATSRARDSKRLDDWGVPVERRAELGVSGDREWPTVHLGADIRIGDSERLPIPGRTITALLTPGHTSGHVSLHDADMGVIMTADHVMPTVHGGLGLGGSSGTNPIADYLLSLRRISEFDDCEVAPGHEYRFHGLAERCATAAEHHLRRTREVLAAIETHGDATVWEIASCLNWTAGWENLRGDYAVLALAQTEMHVDFIRSDAAAPFLGPVGMEARTTG